MPPKTTTKLTETDGELTTTVKLKFSRLYIGATVLYRAPRLIDKADGGWRPALVTRVWSEPYPDRINLVWYSDFDDPNARAGRFVQVAASVDRSDMPGGWQWPEEAAINR